MAGWIKCTSHEQFAASRVSTKLQGVILKIVERCTQHRMPCHVGQFGSPSLISQMASKDPAKRCQTLQKENTEAMQGQSFMTTNFNITWYHMISGCKLGEHFAKPVQYAHNWKRMQADGLSGSKYSLQVWLIRSCLRAACIGRKIHELLRHLRLCLRLLLFFFKKLLGKKQIEEGRDTPPVCTLPLHNLTSCRKTWDICDNQLDSLVRNQTGTGNLVRTACNILQHYHTLSVSYSRNQEIVFGSKSWKPCTAYITKLSLAKRILFPIWVAKPLEVFGSSFKWSKWPFTLPCGIGKKLIAMLKNLLHWHGICLGKLVITWLCEPCQER